MNKMNEIWLRNDKLKLPHKIQVSRSIVKSVLTFDCGTWGLTKAETTKLDAFHGKQLRRLKYSIKITNVNLYKNAKNVLHQKQS